MDTNSDTQVLDEPTPRLQLAGMAMRNGVLVLGPTSFAVAVRLRDGTIRTTTRRRANGGERIIRRIPLLRGPIGLVNMLRVLPAVRRADPAGRLGMESPGVAATLVLGTIISARLRRSTRSPILGELGAGAVSLVATLATLRGGELAAYHGAEHKAIGGYEQDIAAADAPRQHPRCGTQLAIPMLVFSSIATQVLLAVAPRSPRLARNAGQLIGVAAATELFRAGQRGEDDTATPAGHTAALARVAARTGLALQTHATTVEPTRAQLDVAESALAALLRAEHLAEQRAA